MLALDRSFRFELYLSPTDMRKSFDSLCGIVQDELSTLPTDDSVYIFAKWHQNSTVAILGAS